MELVLVLFSDASLSPLGDRSLDFDFLLEKRFFHHLLTIGEPLGDFEGEGEAGEDDNFGGVLYAVWVLGNVVGAVVEVAEVLETDCKPGDTDVEGSVAGNLKYLGSFRDRSVVVIEFEDWVNINVLGCGFAMEEENDSSLIPEDRTVAEDDAGME